MSDLCSHKYISPRQKVPPASRIASDAAQNSGLWININGNASNNDLTQTLSQQLSEMRQLLQNEQNACRQLRVVIQQGQTQLEENLVALQDYAAVKSERDQLLREKEELLKRLNQHENERGPMLAELETLRKKCTRYCEQVSEQSQRIRELQNKQSVVHSVKRAHKEPSTV